MDLKEHQQASASRHPWELARAMALARICAEHRVVRQGMRILDIGCGDGFLVDAICPASAGGIDAVDINLTGETLEAFAKERPRVRFHNSYQSLTAQGYGLLTMFDVLEHVPDDEAFLREMVVRFAAPGAMLYCTAPAFQALFGSHDVFLLHHRRYDLQSLARLLDRVGLRLVGAGYLFGSLLPLRAMMVLAERLGGAGDTDPGIGHWRHGRWLTSVITAFLRMDNSFLLWLGRLGIVVPGLTVWALCETTP